LDDDDDDFFGSFQATVGRLEPCDAAFDFDFTSSRRHSTAAEVDVE
jgi:hypothetical protein